MELAKPTESSHQSLTNTQSETNKNSLEQTTSHYENIQALTTDRSGKDENLQTMATEQNEISPATEINDTNNNPLEVNITQAFNESRDPKANMLQFPKENNETDENLTKPITELDKTDRSAEEYKFKAKIGDLSKIIDNNISNIMTVYSSEEPDSTQAMTAETKQTTERNKNLENLQVIDRSETNENPLELDKKIVDVVEDLKILPNEKDKTVGNQVESTADNIEMVEELQAPITEYIENNDSIHEPRNEIMKAKTENIETDDRLPELKAEINEIMEPATEYNETKDRILELTTEINEIMEPTTEYIETNGRILEMTSEINEIIENIQAMTTERVENQVETTETIERVKNLTDTAPEHEKTDDPMGAFNAKTKNVEALTADKKNIGETRENSDEIENKTVPMRLYHTTAATTDQTYSAQELTIDQSEKNQPLTTDQILRLNETVDNEPNDTNILTANQNTLAEKQTTDQTGNEKIPTTDNDTIVNDETTAIPEVILTTEKPPEKIMRPNFRTIFRQKKPFIPPLLSFGRRKPYKPQRTH